MKQTSQTIETIATTMKPVYKFRVRSWSDKGHNVDYVLGDSVEKARSNWYVSLGKRAARTVVGQIDYAPITPHELKHLVENHRTETHFFTRESMKFSGDTMRNYGVRAQPITVQTYHGPVLAWELYRKRPVKHGLSKSAFFDVETLQQVHEDISKA